MAEICVCSHHASLGELLADDEFRGLLKREGFLIELRLDLYQGLSLLAFSDAVKELGPERLLVTFRSPVEGGRNLYVAEEQRISYLSAAAQLGVAYIDIELSALHHNKLLMNPLLAARGRKPSPKILVSHHDFGGMPSRNLMHELRRKAERLGADIFKVAGLAGGIDDTLPLALVMREETGWTRPMLGLAMGEAGLWTRVLGPIFAHAAPFTFARGENAPGTAPGQPTWRELDELYRFRALKPGDPVYGVIGHPIGHSLSPRMHNAALAALGLPGVYLPFLVENPVYFVREMTGPLGIRGLSVTIPHKETVLECSKEIEPLAARIGAANTLVSLPSKSGERPRWRAGNTDAHAAAASLEAALGGPGSLEGKKVLILGAGGAARAVACGVQECKAEVLVFNRTPERAAKLAQEVGGKVVSRKEIGSAGVVAVVNTTPLGMFPHVDGCALEENELPEGSLIFDTVYNPLRTKLLRGAEARGLRTLNGLAMFVGQGAEQFRRFTGQDAPREVMEKVVRKALGLDA